MKRILLTGASVLVGALLFFGVAYANEWISFTGDEQITESDDHVAEILEILEQVNQGKITAEEGLATAEERIKELEDMNPSGLAKKNKELREEVANLQETNDGLVSDNENLTNSVSNLQEEVERLKTDNAQLTTEQANLRGQIEDKDSQISDLNDTISTKNDEYDKLQQERDGLQTRVNELQDIIDNHDDNSEYVEHLEDELQRANTKVSEHNSVTEEALEKAREISGEE